MECMVVFNIRFLFFLNSTKFRIDQFVMLMVLVVCSALAISQRQDAHASLYE